jgi:hypothetical protein
MVGLLIGANVSSEKNGDMTPGFNSQCHISVVYESWTIRACYRVLPGKYKEQTSRPEFIKIYQHDMNELMLSGGRVFRKNVFIIYSTLQLLYVNTIVATAMGSSALGQRWWFIIISFFRALESSVRCAAIPFRCWSKCRRSIEN